MVAVTDVRRRRAIHPQGVTEQANHRSNSPTDSSTLALTHRSGPSDHVGTATLIALSAAVLTLGIMAQVGLILPIVALAIALGVLAVPTAVTLYLSRTRSRGPIRTAIDGVLSGTPDIAVTASTASRAVETATAERTQVAIVDYGLEDGDALAICAALKALREPPRVLLFSVRSGDLLPVLAAIAGADGTLGRGVLGDDVRAAVRDVHFGVSLQAVVSPSTLPPLSPGELRLMSLLPHRATPSDAATRLGISTQAVERHRRSLLARLRERAQRDRRQSPLAASTHEAAR
jgi:DNA-binding NarL/FixJ family response regulator